MLAQVNLIGNLGRDPEVRAMSSGDSYARFSVAVNKVAKGEKTTMWVDVAVFDPKKVEVLQTYARKGTKVFVNGDLATRDYTDKSGANRTAVEVVVGRFGGQLLLLGDRGGDASPAPATQSAAAANPFDDLDDDVVPF